MSETRNDALEEAARIIEWHAAMSESLKRNSELTKISRAVRALKSTPAPLSGPVFDADTQIAEAQQDPAWVEKWEPAGRYQEETEEQRMAEDADRAQESILAPPSGDGMLQYGPFMCTDDHAVQCAYLMSLAAEAADRDVLTNDWIGHILFGFACCDIEFDDAVAQLEETE